MAATIDPKEAVKRDPMFFKRREAHRNWSIQTGEFPQDWRVETRFGAVKNVVVCDPNTGKPAFDRPAYYEAPAVNVVAWGKMPDGTIKIGVIHEARPHADDPRNPESREAVVVGQIPMGFMEKVMGKLESGSATAQREVLEETGAAVVERMRPKHPYHNPNPTFVATWTDLWFVEVDLDRLEQIKPQHGEIIYKAEYITVPELRRRVANGEHEGALYRAATTLSALFIFFCVYPEFFTP